MNEKIIDKIYEQAKNYRDPVTNKIFDKFNKDIVIVVKEGNVNISLDIDPNKENEYQELIKNLKEKIKRLENILSVSIVLTSEKKMNSKSEKNKKFNINVKNIIAIASGKGGVGKSTFAVNFAVALKKNNFKVGILDADIYGPSIPKMIGISEKPKTNEKNKLIPLIGYGIKCMSIGFLISTDTPAIWRGPMVMKALEQMYNGVEWGELDYLIIDLPPGTGDAQITLAQSSKINGSIIISTPQDLALIDAIKGINMFKKVNVPILGIVENMSYFICESCNQRHEIFSNGGVKIEAEKIGTKFLGEIPLNKKLRIQSDIGKPICEAEPNSEISKTYLSIADNINKLLNY